MISRLCTHIHTHTPWYGSESGWQHCLITGVPFSSNTGQASSLSTSPVTLLPSPLGPQLKTPPMSSNWQRLHHFHSSLFTEWGIKMLEAETIDFLLFFGCCTSLLGHLRNSSGTWVQCTVYNALLSKILISVKTRAACEMLRMCRRKSLVTAISKKKTRQDQAH